MITRVDSSQRKQEWVVHELDPDGGQDNGCSELGIQALEFQSVCQLPGISSICTSAYLSDDSL